MPDAESATQRLAAWKLTEQPTPDDGVPDVEQRPPRCMLCGYNLTALTSPRCPECDWAIDWRLVWLDEEADRRGTPVHLARGWESAWGVIATLLFMLFRPISFAKRLRADESWLSAIVVALLACLGSAAAWWSMHGFRDDDLRWGKAYSSAIIACILVNTIGYLIVSCGHPGPQRFKHRLKLFLLLSLYSTCFVATWAMLGAPPVLSINFLSPFNERSGWPANSSDDWSYGGRTIIFYWWVLILWVFVFVRTKPRWMSVVFVPVPFLAAYAAYIAAAWSYRF